MLFLQDPTNNESTTLLESLSDALASASSFAGMFAFASSSGVDLFAELEHFQQVANMGTVDLVIGLDVVTNPKAIDALLRVRAKYPKVTIRALLNPKPSGLFHPKFAFTKNAGGGVQITGSGNLTEGGLIGNWEAYSVEHLNDTKIAATQASFDEWIARHSASLFPIDEPRVRERAAANTIMAREGDLPTLIAHPKAEEADTEQVMPNDAAVLIAEIPASSNRWKQANFDIDNFTRFFGVGQDASERLWVFRHVNEDGTMAEYERPRPPVPVRSQNYRFELAAAAGLPYPDHERVGRPIGVFVRMTARTYFYRLLMPDDSEYQTVSDILAEMAGPEHRRDRVRRERTTVGELKQLWPNSPLWKLPSLD